MATVFVLCAVLLAAVSAEPPVHSSYLPPSSRGAPSSQYGPPSSFDSFRSASSPLYLPPSNNVDVNAFQQKNEFDDFSAQLSNTYGPPSQDAESFDSDSVAVDAARSLSPRPPAPVYGAPTGLTSASYRPPSPPSFRASPAFSPSAARPSAFRSAPSSFGASSRFAQPSAKYGPPSPATMRSNGFASGPVSSYTPQRNGLSNRYSAPAPANTYGAPFNGASESRFAAAPSNVYGVPSNGYPSARSAVTEDPFSEPARYEYNYEVQAADESGTEFGHQETRENESARGSYHVLLPDGRMQIVEYEADESGYRPKIRYEETGYPAARSGHNGY